MSPNPLLPRTKQFAHRCIRLALSLPKTLLGNHIRKQLLRCGTSVAANYRAACIAPTRRSFANKLSICAEEADESAFWMETIIDERVIAYPQSQLLESHPVSPLLREAEELTKIFVSSRKTLGQVKDRKL